MNKNLLILGAGQYGTVVKEIAEEMGCFDKIDFLDDSYGTDNPNYHEEAIGTIKDMASFSGDYFYAIPAIGIAESRLALIQKIKEETTFQIPVIVSPRAYISKSAQLQKGTVIEPLAGVHANTVIGIASYVSMGAVVNHNAVVLEGCHIDNNAVVMSGALVVAKTYIDPCTVVRRAAKKYTIGQDGHITEESMGSFPQYDKDAEWVQQYIKENGHEPTFF